MTDWLIDTFVYTGALIALVLVIRRPVAHLFGPQIAYALWALPMLRLVLPPVVLPAALAPQETEPAMAAAAKPAAETSLVEQAVLASGPAAKLPSPIDWEAVAVSVWLGGALAFLVWRIHTYLRMRQELLAEARPAGESGSVRLVETPAVRSPLAFGVRDRVVALPMFFMALEQRDARDLAIAHELEHHRGRDLLVNFAAQLLLALHWFNPIAWLGWRAMRRDQEAACDARVMAGRNMAERACYAQVIAGFAAGPRLALAAPMACPVLGEKSIIHRLRALGRSESSRRRRWAGRGVLLAGAAALPFTASVSYAEADVPQAIESIDPSAADGAAAQVPVPPAPPMPPAAPLPPEAPEAPLAPAAPAWDGDYDFDVDFDTDVDVDVDIDEEELAQLETEIERMADQQERRAERAEALAEREEERAREIERRIEVQVRRQAARAEAQARAASARAARQVANADNLVRNISMVINCGGEESFTVTPANAEAVAVKCEKSANAYAILALRTARDALASEASLPADARAEALRDIDQEIRRLNEAG